MAGTSGNLPRISCLLIVFGLLLSVVIQSTIAAPQEKQRQHRKSKHRNEGKQRKVQSDDEDIVMTLEPEGPITLEEGEGITFTCKVWNKPPESQIQWYYIVRNEDATNYTILANEYLTIDSRRYKVQFITPNLYTLYIRYFRRHDSGEYACFLWSARPQQQSIDVNIVPKGSGEQTDEDQPTTTPEPEAPATTTTAAPTPPTEISRVKIKQLVEKEMAHEFKSHQISTNELRKLKTDTRTKGMMDKATDKILALLYSNTTVKIGDSEQESEAKVTGRLSELHPQTQSIIDNLIKSINQVVIPQLREAAKTTSQSKGKGKSSKKEKGKHSGSSSSGSSSSVFKLDEVETTTKSAFDLFLDELYKKTQAPEAEETNSNIGGASDNSVEQEYVPQEEFEEVSNGNNQNSNSQHERQDGEEEEEQTNYIETHRITATTNTHAILTTGELPDSDQSGYSSNNNHVDNGYNTYGTSNSHVQYSNGNNNNYNTVSTGGEAPTQCQYQLIVNEVDPTQCPQVFSGHRGLEREYQSDYPPSKRPASTQNGEDASFEREVSMSPVASTGLEKTVSKIEDRLIDEIVKHRIVNDTVAVHDSKLQKTEATLSEQTANLSKLAAELAHLKKLIKTQRHYGRNLDSKIASAMVNIDELNKRYDNMVSKMPVDKSPERKKTIPVESAGEANCHAGADQVYFKDCNDVLEQGNTRSDVYYIKPIYSPCAVPVWCDMDTHPGGWLTIQRRQEGSMDFNQDWDTYRHGFGNVTRDYWLGNDNIFLLTNQEEYILRVDLWDFYGSRVYAEYQTFKIEGNRDNYTLRIGNYSGTASDSLGKHDGLPFSTHDRDNDAWSDYHCAFEWTAGWWYSNCWHAFLNGEYHDKPDVKYQGMAWTDWKREQLKHTEMKIRPVIKPKPKKKSKSKMD